VKVHPHRDLPRRPPFRPIEKVRGVRERRQGFTLTRRQFAAAALTREPWTAGPEALQAHKDEAIAVQSEEVYDRYMHYLDGPAPGVFGWATSTSHQFTLAK